MINKRKRCFDEEIFDSVMADFAEGWEGRGKVYDLIDSGIRQEVVKVLEKVLENILVTDTETKYINDLIKEYDE